MGLDNEIRNKKPEGIGHLVALVGVAFTFFTFLAFFYSWEYARGFFCRFGVPADLVSFYDGLQIFPIAGISTVSMNVMLIVFGLFIIYTLKMVITKRIGTLFISVSVVIGVLVVAGRYSVSGITMFLSWVILCIAFGVNMLTDYKILTGISRVLVGIVLLMQIVVVSGEWNAVFGREGAERLMKNFDWTQYNFKPYEILLETPVVSLISKRELAFNIKPLVRGGYYFYDGSGINKLRLIYAASDMYYIV